MEDLPVVEYDPLWIYSTVLPTVPQYILYRKTKTKERETAALKISDCCTAAMKSGMYSSNLPALNRRLVKSLHQTKVSPAIAGHVRLASHPLWTFHTTWHLELMPTIMLTWSSKNDSRIQDPRIAMSSRIASRNIFWRHELNRDLFTSLRWARLISN